MKLKIAEDLNDTPVTFVDLHDNDGVKVTVQTVSEVLGQIDLGEEDVPSEGVSLAGDGVIDVVIDTVSLSREQIAAALRQVNSEMGTVFELE